MSIKRFFSLAARFAWTVFLYAGALLGMTFAVFLGCVTFVAVTTHYQETAPEDDGIVVSRSEDRGSLFIQASEDNDRLTHEVFELRMENARLHDELEVLTWCYRDVLIKLAPPSTEVTAELTAK